MSTVEIIVLLLAIAVVVVAIIGIVESRGRNIIAWAALLAVAILIVLGLIRLPH